MAIDKLIESLELSEQKSQDQFEKELESQAFALSNLEAKLDSKLEYELCLIGGHVISKKAFGKISVVQLENHQYGVIDASNNIIVPFGKYAFIDGFENGLSRVRTFGDTTYTKNILGILDLKTMTCIEGQEAIKKYKEEDARKHPEKYSKWGIINEDGVEVLPAIYDEIWNFYGKGRYCTIVERNLKFFFRDLNPKAIETPLSLGTSIYYESKEDYLDDAYEGYSPEYLGLD